MTTQAWTFPIDHGGDAGFRAWGADFSAKLAAVGLVQTADTGQINWATVNRAGTNSNAGYEIWRFNDSMQGTAPIFLKIFYGTGSLAASPRIQIIVGTASNGSGTISGIGSSVTLEASVSNGGTAAGTSRNNYMCAVDGAWWFAWGQNLTGGGSNCNAYFAVCRTVDSTMTPTAVGAQVMFAGNAGNGSIASCRNIRFQSTAALYAQMTNGAFCVLPSGESSTLVGSDTQLALAFIWTPRALPNAYLGGVLSAEHALGSTFSATLVGASAHTYISMAGMTGPLFNTWPALIWE